MTDPLDRQSPSGRRLQTAAPFVSVPLSAAYYVDLATVVPSADRNGAIATPFSLLSAAYAVTVPGDVIVLTPTSAGGSYQALAMTRNLVVQSIDDSAIAVPNVFADNFTTITTDCHGFILSDCQAGFANLLLGELVLNDATACASLSNCRIALVSAAAGETVVAEGCSFTGPVTANQLNVAQCAFGGDGLTAAAPTLTDTLCQGAVTQIGAGGATLRRSRAIEIVADAGVDLRDSVVGNVSGADGSFAYSFAGTVTLTGGGNADGSSFSGIVTIGGNADLRRSTFGIDVAVTGNAVVEGCSFSGNLTVGGNLTIDSVTYLATLQAGHTITVTGTLTVVGAGAGHTQKQLAWNPQSSANSNVFALLPAGHAPGIYQINVAAIIRANATVATSIAQKIICDGITQTLSVVTASGSGFASGTVPRFAMQTSLPGCLFFVPQTVFSDGVAAVSVQLLSVGFTGTPSVDIFASASFMGQG